MKLQYLLIILIAFAISCTNNEDSHQHNHEHHGHHHDHNKSNKHMNKTSFEELVARFEDSTRVEWQKPDEVVALLGEIDGKTIMDIGAGTGYFAFRLAEKGANVIAADVDERFIDFINKKENDKVTTRKVPFDSPNLAKAEVDAVIIVNTYHHIENRTDYFKQVLDGLKENGQLMIVDFKKQKTTHGPPVDHKFTEAEVMEELKTAGFTEFEVNSELLEEQYVIMAK
ncbi:MAG: class I SAM-dependent methyltransferase [Saprospiraceae bacterium]